MKDIFYKPKISKRLARLCALAAALCLAALALAAPVRPAMAPDAAPIIALTFDDGPYPAVTGHILDIIEANGVCATFFVLGSRIAGREDTLIRMEALGCEVGNHSFSHADLTRLSLADCQKELDSTDAELERVLGHKAAVVRPPYGYYNSSVLAAAGRPLALWTIDTNDWRGIAPEKIAQQVIEQAKQGSVILLHDQQSQTADAMEIIIPQLLSEGFRFVTVSQLIKESGGQCKGIKLAE